LSDTRRHGRSGHVLALGVLVLFIDGYDLFVLGAVGPALLQYAPWGVTPATLGLLGSVTAVGGALGAVVAGWSGDVLGRRLPMAVSVVWVAVWMALSALAPNVELFAATRLATGLGLGALIPLVVAVVAEAAPASRRSFFVGVAMTGIARSAGWVRRSPPVRCSAACRSRPCS
jgi:MFS transporter, AAHS family, benzoate transport protein